MQYVEHAIGSLVLHDWKDAKEWASALAVLSDLTDIQIDERLRLAMISPSELAQDCSKFETAETRFRRQG